MPKGNSLPQTGKTILVVEDEPEVRRVVVLMLNRLGYAVLQAGDATEAWSILEKNGEIDLLLSDVVMPGTMDGPGLAGKARLHLPRLKVLLMSGYGDTFFTPHGGAKNAAPLLRKPYTIEELARELETLLAG